MSRERMRQEFEKYAKTFHNSPMIGDCWSLDRQVPHEDSAYINIYVEQHWEIWQAGMEAGERLGREDSDNISWDALREQWRIEFGRELGQQRGHIMNIVDGVRELVREEREKVLADFRTVRPNI